ncbi:DNA-binding transcriptional regulator, MarR family [Quadrisphaera granulorum]|uniref:DNA-binding MarR family transcriptional regulator n=1 Tax=Quadrisphaera granulorum TaxID=317664 RepID=A0A316ABZ4_9ACTN|nr:MarR family winged helix-turn-helix transcriptional regulator [Quadrisphaera granulorum]PWJ54394.1 DNA-binding MarR family transcriptional regulator [Quadrisphaera granulorum]SZE96166.1 DNA-binding transcriptional regulator, MarR family [Quadrisphaera granulorum]
MVMPHEWPNGGRAAEDIVTEPLSTRIDLEEFTPRLVYLVSNALVWQESHEMRRRFGLGTNDWRVISALGWRPGLSATEVTRFLGVNKAVVSKSVAVLVDRALVALLQGPRGSRPMYLTRAGAEMHDQMVPVSHRGHELITTGLEPEQVTRLNELLREMLGQLRGQSVEGDGAVPVGDLDQPPVRLDPRRRSTDAPREP